MMRFPLKLIACVRQRIVHNGDVGIGRGIWMRLCPCPRGQQEEQEYKQ
jgi:hypothetical protein